MGVWPRTVYFLLESRPYGVWDRMGTTTSLLLLLVIYFRNLKTILTWWWD